MLLDEVAKGGLGKKSTRNENLGDMGQGVADVAKKLVLGTDSAAMLSGVVHLVVEVRRMRLPSVQLHDECVVMVDQYYSARGGHHGCSVEE